MADNVVIIDEDNAGQRFDKFLIRRFPVGGKGFVMMPTSCPCGRKITKLCLRNYERMIEMAEGG